MKRTLLTLLTIPAALALIGQARVVFTGDPYVVFNPNANPGTYLVIDNPNANAIVNPDQGNIISEREENKVRWVTATSTGLYEVPWTTRAPGLVKMRLTVNKTGAGVGAANSSLVFSTYNYQSNGLVPANGWNNFLYMPSDVTHMNDLATGTVNNSNNVIDRFWVIDTQEAGWAYTTKPALSMTFRYDPNDILASNVTNGGVISPASVLQAQRFNTVPQLWGDMLPIGTPGVNQVSNVAPAVADLFRSWTLVEQNNPLPISLTDFQAGCDGRVVRISWTTATEQDNDYFTIEKSRDGLHFESIGVIPGAGNSLSTIAYEFVDDDAMELAYYRLRQTDFDGTTTVSHMVTGGCSSAGGIEIVNAWDDGGNVNVVVTSSEDHVFDLTLLDAHGRTMLARRSEVVGKGLTRLMFPSQDIATGIYIIQLHNNQQMLSRRILLN